MAKGKKTGGRRPGSVNKQTAGVKAVAQQYTAMAVTVLVEIAKNIGAPPQARVAACNALLDRGHGKPTQPHDVSGHDGGPIVFEVITNVAHQ